MDNYVRVADKETGHHVSITRSQYDVSPEAWRELDSDATYADGTPLAPKYKTDVDTAAADKTSRTRSRTSSGGSASPTSDASTEAAKSGGQTPAGDKE